MQSDALNEPDLTATHLPRPRGNARWRWSPPRRALVAGGTLAVVLGLGAGGAGAATSGSTSGSGQPPSGAHASSGGARSQPTVSGKVTGLSGDDITLQTQGDKSVTVVYSSNTTFKAMAGTRGAGTTSSSSAAALKVGDFVGVDGTKDANGTVSASSVTVGSGMPPGGRGGPPGHKDTPPGQGGRGGSAPNGSAAA
jgi:Domain of unknown function (DUF5666)